jgi:hypothetical protein
MGEAIFMDSMQRSTYKIVLLRHGVIVPFFSYIWEKIILIKTIRSPEEMVQENTNLNEELEREKK